MIKEIKKFLLNSIKQNKKGLILALLFFVIFGLIAPYLSTFAQAVPHVTTQPTSTTTAPASSSVPGLNCSWWDVGCIAANFILSALIKIVVLIFFGIPLLLSAIFVGLTGIILGWIISPDFISLKFTQNPFVDIGLSITRGFANMAFIIFLVVIALATTLRIEQYKAKKTIPVLIMIALLINFSPVFCGFIIDASNIVMNFFLNNITGINGFVNFVQSAFNQLWNLLWTSGFDAMANLAAAAQIIISVIFNFFAGFVLICFCALFIMRYVMLWILVIISPIAFVSYILPMTRNGKYILNWRRWWEQLVEWSVVGIVGGFFLYLGFTMITMINANPRMFVTEPNLSWGGGPLGIVDNILPYLIPLVLLWIGYQQTKKTSAMFAREVMEIPEKVTKAAVSTAIMAGAAVATAGIGAAAGAAGGAAKGLPGAISRTGQRLKDYGAGHPYTLRGTVAGKLGGWEKGFEGWAKARKEATEDWIHRREEGYETYKGEHPRFSKIAGAGGKAGGWMKDKAKEGLDEALYGYTKKEKVEGRPLKPEEVRDKIRYKETTTKETKTMPINKMEGYTKAGDDIRFKDPKTGEIRPPSQEEAKKGTVSWEEEKKELIKTDQKLTQKEIESHHLTEIKITRRPGGIIPSIEGGFKQAWKEIENKYVKEIGSLSEDLRKEALAQARRDLETIGHLGDETKEKLRNLPEFRLMENESKEPILNDIEEWLKKKKGGKKPDSGSEE